MAATESKPIDEVIQNLAQNGNDSELFSGRNLFMWAMSGAVAKVRKAIREDGQVMIGPIRAFNAFKEYMATQEPPLFATEESTAAGMCSLFEARPCLILFDLL